MSFIVATKRFQLVDNQTLAVIITPISRVAMANVLNGNMFVIIRNIVRMDPMRRVAVRRHAKIHSASRNAKKRRWVIYVHAMMAMNYCQIVKAVKIVTNANLKSHAHTNV